MPGTALTTLDHSTQLALQEAADRTQDFIHASIAPGTRRVYRRNWADFASWCERYGLAPLPATPDAVALYVADLAATRKPATLTLRLSAISQAHQAAGYESPTHAASVRKTMAGVRRTLGAAPVTKAPITVTDLQRITGGHLRPGIRGTRDRALLLIGFAGAFRRSELVSLNVEDVEHVPEGIVLTLKRSKTDQEGIGRRIGIPHGGHEATCPVRALDAWLALAGLRNGAIFRPIDRHGNVSDDRLSDHAVAEIVKLYAARIGRDASHFAGHSLRSGFATAAAREGAAERDIMAQTGHRSAAMVRRYIRDGSLFRRNAAAQLGL
jgi:integrase